MRPLYPVCNKLKGNKTFPDTLQKKNKYIFINVFRIWLLNDFSHLRLLLYSARF